MRTAAFGDPKGTLSHVKKNHRRRQQLSGHKNHCQPWDRSSCRNLGLGTGIDFSVIWGLLAFLLNFIPNLGSIITAVPPVRLGYIQFGIGGALLVVAGFGIVNLIFGNVVEPKFMGRMLAFPLLWYFYPWCSGVGCGDQLECCYRFP